MRDAKNANEFNERMVTGGRPRFKQKPGAILFFAALFAGAFLEKMAMSQSASSQSNGAVLAEICSDRTLWGKDFASVVASLPAFQKAGERRVAVFADRIIGDLKYKTREDAQREAGEVALEVKAAPARFNPQYEVLLRRNFQRRAVTLKPEVILFADDNTIRVAGIGLKQEFLYPGLTIADVRKRLGQPEKITKEVLDGGAERRPVILTLYHYAGEAVIFAESDWAPKPGLVDRAMLAVPAAAAALFQEAK